MDENLFELSQGWVWTELKIVCEKIQDGSHFSPQIQYTEPGEGRYLYITAKNIKPNGLDLSNVTYVDETFHKSIYERCNPQKGDVLLTKDGVKTGVVALNTLDDEFSLLSSVALFKTNKIILIPNYLRYFLSSPVGLRITTGQMTGTAIKRIVLDKIRQSYICLPPLAEQYRIVAKIEELFTQLDAGVELLKKVKAKLKRYRQAVLKAAVEGDLTKEWRTAHQGELEPASVLLERILKQRREKWEAEQLAKMQAQGKTPKDDKWKLKYKEPVAPNTSDLPDLPDGWVWVSAEQCTSLITDGEHITPERSESGVLLLSARNVQNGWLSLEDVDYVPEHIYQILAKRFIVEPGDVLLSCSGSVGRSCIAPENLKFALVRSVAVLKSIFQMGRFLSYCMRSPLLQSQIHEKKTQTAQANIFQGKIKQLVFPLPNLLEQEKIVKETEYCFSVIDQLEKTVDTNIKRAEKLRQSILKQAFTGQLVPQDPNDEPAEKLLERIKAEKAKQVTTKTKKKTTSISKTKSPTQLALPLE